MIKQWIGDDQVKFNKIYQGTVDGVLSGDIHRKCDDKGPTLILIKSGKDRVFGAYISVSFKTV